MNKQSVTISLPKSLLKKAKVLAASKEESLSELFKEALEEKIRKDAEYQKARKRQVRLLNMGLELGTKGHITFSKEKLHARG